MLKPEAAARKDATSGKGKLEHRHFATFAAILREVEAPTELVEKFADSLADTNPRFDRKRFLTAVKGN